MITLKALNWANSFLTTLAKIYMCLAISVAALISLTLAHLLLAVAFTAYVVWRIITDDIEWLKGVTWNV